MHLKTLTQPKRMLEILLMKYYWLFPTKIYLKLLFRLKMGYRLDLKNPKTFSEKLQWLKLYNRKPEYTKMVDKATVKDYVADIIGSEYIIPTIGIWNTPDEIDFEQLPNQFVLKTTHGGGSSGVVICKDKTNFDTKAARKKMARSMKQDIWHVLKEWPYKDVKPRIIAETYMESSPDVNDLIDYKWYCFNGEPKYCQVIQDRKKKETIDFFDTEWNHQDFVGLIPASGPTIGSASIVPLRPKNLDIQIEIARKLAQGMPFSRIDLYEINDKEFFGEITLYPASGLGIFKPDQYNEILGKMLTLPDIKLGGGKNCSFT